MIKIVTWNIQYGKGVDGRIDFKNISKVIKEIGGAEIICLQEISRNNPDLDYGAGDDQVILLREEFPDYTVIFGPAIDSLDRDNKSRCQFGNVVMSKFPVTQIFNHSLPQPCPESDCFYMPRQALEVIVEKDNMPLRIITTHLEFYSQIQRLAQISYLNSIQDDLTLTHKNLRGLKTNGLYPLIDRPIDHILCGDFNILPHEIEYHHINGEELSAVNSGYFDVWTIIHKNKPHCSTCGIYDFEQWPQGPNCRDYFFITDGLKKLLVDIFVEKNTRSSDHQPLVMVLTGFD